eukprot:CAMPEP_0194203018 /NCGR_PEP_ID=MMETSP0156-20130528/2909_1 /TAXON_ID=33649 /ORGANISM="Thalassionema nitzschioides, Strain L26-B" /LENGTH=328 /DNA_ID=CAMNT_0038928677 /DNA_START=12 /DNA_END=998 /DNA_ORIENTATION=-
MIAEESIVDELRAMLQQESNPHYGKQSYYSSLYDDTIDDAPNKKNQVNEGWRQKICEWLFEVTDHFQFDREVVVYALHYLDRAASIEVKTNGKAIPPREFQLMALTCFYIATKLHGEIPTRPSRCKLKIDVFVELSRGLLTVDTLEAKEREILTKLDWRVNPPSSSKIVASLVHFLPLLISNTSHNSGRPLNLRAEIYETSRYLLELGVCVSSITLNYDPSEIAYACILCSFDALDISIPYDIKVHFINEVAASTGLSPGSVSSLKGLLKNLCPSMFVYSEEEDNAIFSQADDDDMEERANNSSKYDEQGKESPVCVVNQFRKQDNTV